MTFEAKPKPLVKLVGSYFGVPRSTIHEMTRSNTNHFKEEISLKVLMRCDRLQRLLESESSLVKGFPDDHAVDAPFG